MQDNINTMKDPQPLSVEELAALQKAAAVYWGEVEIPCTACRYCVEDCPKEIPIPDIFAAVNEAKNKKEPAQLSKLPGGKAADCIRCGKCEKSCPQHLPIRALLRRLAAQKV